MKKKAFTLIELLAAVVVLAVVLSITTFSVISILNKSKISSLKNTALNIRQAAKLHQSKNYKVQLNSIDLTPNIGKEADIIKLDVDPWDDEYISIKAYYEEVNKKIQVTVVIITANHGNWILYPEASDIEELTLKIFSMHIPDEDIKTNDFFNIHFTIPEFYGDSGYTIDGLSFRLQKDGINSNDYQAGAHNFVRDTEGFYNAQLKITASGIYDIYLTPKAGSNTGLESGPLTVSITDNLLPASPALMVQNVQESYFDTGDQWTGTSQERRMIELKITNPSGLTPLTMTIQVRQPSGSFVNSVINHPINTTDTYIVKSSSILGTTTTISPYTHIDGYEYNSPPEWITFSKDVYEFKVLINYGTNTYTSPPIEFVYEEKEWWLD